MKKLIMVVGFLMVALMASEAKAEDGVSLMSSTCYVWRNYVPMSMNDYGMSRDEATNFETMQKIAYVSGIIDAYNMM